MRACCTYRVGAITTAPISRLPRGLSRRASRSMTGMTNASVLPDPVTACEQRKLSNQSSSLSLAQQGDTHLDDDVLVLQEEGDGSGLDWGHLFESHIAYDIGAASGMPSVTLYAGLSESTGENEAVLEAHIHGVSAGWMRDHGPAYDGAAASLSVAISSSSCYAVRAEWLIDSEPPTREFSHHLNS